jgi:methyl-accepting chemotaxis protein
VGVEFTLDTNKQELKEELLANFERYSDGEIEKSRIFEPIDRLRNKAILMIVIILFVMLIVLTMFIKNITEPLQHMIEASREISKGDLSQTIRIRADNELAQLGNVINELASNLQEIILLSRNACASGYRFIERTSYLLEHQVADDASTLQIREEIRQVKKEFQVLYEIIQYFSFYSVQTSKDDGPS